MGIQIVAFLLGVIATASCATTTFWNLWAFSGPASNERLDPIWTWQGLWESCMQYTGEQYTCYQDVSVFETPVYIVVLRGLMCVAMCLSFFACTLSLVGLECSRIMEEKQNWKRRMMFVSGIMHLTASVLTLISVAWFTSMIVQKFFSFENQDNIFKDELGGAIYLGFSSSLISLAASLCCFCMQGPKDMRSSYTSAAYSYDKDKFAQKTSRTEYV